MNTPSRQLQLGLVALVVSSVSLVVVFWTLRAPEPPIYLPPLDGLATALAEQTAKLVAGQGRVVVVARDLRQFPSAPGKVLSESFQRALQAHPGVVVSANHWVNPVNATPADSGFPAKLYFEVLAAHADADVLVSLMDAPLLTDDDLGRLPARHPKLVAVLSATTVGSLDKLLAAGVLNTAIVPRRQPSAETATPQTPAEWFEHSYEVVTR